MQNRSDLLTKESHTLRPTLFWDIRSLVRFCQEYLLLWNVKTDFIQRGSLARLTLTASLFALQNVVPSHLIGDYGSLGELILWLDRSKKSIGRQYYISLILVTELRIRIYAIPKYYGWVYLSNLKQTTFFVELGKCSIQNAIRVWRASPRQCQYNNLQTIDMIYALIELN